MALRSQAISLGTNAALVSEVKPLTPAGRRLRNPEHTFRLRTEPYVIQPMMIAPVLPGETMRNLLLQARAVTDPLKDKLGGWWHEYYFFYVKHRDLAARDALVDMHVKGSSISTLNAAANTPNYHMGGAPDYVQMCLESVTEWYFREPEEAWNATGTTVTIDGKVMPLSRTMERKWWDSLKLAADQPADDSNLPGIYPEILPTHLAQFQEHYDQYTWMRENKLTDATFEDYLRTFGIRAEAGAREDEHKPELVRYIRDWVYPSNTINPADGAASSAASWAIRERADKDRFFKEPGFLFGVTVTRPKVFFKNQKGYIASTWDTPLEWLPALARENAYMSLTEEARTAGPIAGIADAADTAYWWDQRDLLLYGDQFINFNPATALQPGDFNAVSLPVSGGSGVLVKDFVSRADYSALFAGYSTNPSDNGLNKIRVDGVVRLSISGHQRDHT